MATINDNIYFFLTEDTNEETNNEINLDKLENDILFNIDNSNSNSKIIELENLFLSNFVNYSENFTVKELLIICEYYGVLKEIKSNKYNKEQIIHFLVSFEANEENSDIVFKRKNMWFYMNELKNDKFMKKYVLW
jgi:hypothetical protein